jgi:dTDP-4-dehydrorhamnose reductase
MARRPLEMWGGIESTINRVGDCYGDQAERCGHYARLTDLDAIAGLGIRTLRYPALWERVAPSGRMRNWDATDRALERMRRLGIDPIIGLLHHGSGPSSTNLLDSRFPRLFAGYAKTFASRHPWVRHYTPINEPLTTARFSALYGLWHPHRSDDRSFVTALLLQCRAIVTAMASIRRIVPDAQLIQTEDAGSVSGSLALADQVRFESERVWLSLDLLMGRVTPAHPLWAYLLDSGASTDDLNWLGDHATRPDLIGLNYYVTSDRYLDDRLDRHPIETHGGNGRQRYADVAAARVANVGIRGHAAMLEEAWARYQTPLAITEAHLGCTREEQMRWLLDAWIGALQARASGVDVRAVTAWALLGSWDWDSLLTIQANHYEPGAYDVRGGTPRPTAVAQIVSELTAGHIPCHPVLSAPGWWWRHSTGSGQLAPPILIVGSNGTLGTAFARSCESRGLQCIALSREDLDITHPSRVRAALLRFTPWAVVNAAGYVRVDQAETDRDVCRRINVVGAAVLAALCRRHGVRLLTFSSDLVFDGAATRPYVESDSIGPQNVYGRTKAQAERRVSALDPDALIVRTSAFFGPWDQHNFVTTTLAALEAGRTVRALSDLTVSPTYVPDLVNASLDLLIDGAVGIWHVANAGEVTWAEFAGQAARAAGLDRYSVEPCSASELKLAAPRPVYTALGSERGILLPPLDDALARYLRDRERRDVMAA